MTDTMIKSFLTVCRTNSITRAASICNLTQQAVSKHIAGMESELGVQLFFRDNKTMVMSPAGHKYFDFFASCVRSFDDLRYSISEKAVQSMRILRISYLERLLLPDPFRHAIFELKRKYPHFSVHCMTLDESEVEDALFNGECDMFVGYDIFHHRNQHPTVKQRKLFVDPIYYAVSVHNPAGKNARQLSDLNGQPFYFQTHQRFLTYSHQESIDSMLRQCEADGFSPGEIIMCEHYSDSKLCVIMGEGVFLTSSFESLCSDPSIRLFPSNIISDVNCAYISNNINPVMEPLFSELDKIIQFKGKTASK